MLCVLDEFEPKEATNLVVSPECIKQVLDESPDVMLEELPDKLLNELPDELPPRR